jgi:sec-independent protein translocase protein TatA
MELMIVLAVALLVLGPRRLPEAGRSLGQGLREFKDGIRGGGARTGEPVLEAGPDAEPALGAGRGER